MLVELLTAASMMIGSILNSCSCLSRSTGRRRCVSRRSTVGVSSIDLQRSLNSFRVRRVLAVLVLASPPLAPAAAAAAAVVLVLVVVVVGLLCASGEALKFSIRSSIASIRSGFRSETRENRHLSCF